MVNKPIESYKIVIERFFIFNWQVVTIGLTHWPLSNMEAFFKCVFQTSCIKPYLEHFVCNWSSVGDKERQYWFREWLGAARQQAINWGYDGQDLCHHISSLGHNELKKRPFPESRMITKH